MANSRLEKIGTIYSRINGLLRSGAMKFEDKPLWYDVYEAFPPKLEPKFDRPAPQMEVRQIFYEEDVIRAKFHKAVKNFGTVTLKDTQNKTQSQLFTEIYKKLQDQGPISEDKLFECAQEMLQIKLAEMKVDRDANRETHLLTNFKNASTKTATPTSGPSVNIQDIFKD